MKTITYRGYTILTDGTCFYVAFEQAEERPFDTCAEARAYIDACRLNRTLGLMARS